MNRCLDKQSLPAYNRDLIIETSNIDVGPQHVRNGAARRQKD